MKIGVLVTGLFRNFQKPMSNWLWPEGAELEHHLITWDVTSTTHLDDDQKVSVWSSVEEASKILHFNSVHIYSDDLIINKVPPTTPAIDHGQTRVCKQFFLWLRAVELSQKLDCDFYVLIRPDCIWIPRSPPSFEAIHPFGGINLYHSNTDGLLHFVGDCVVIWDHNVNKQIFDWVVDVYNEVDRNDPAAPYDVHDSLGRALMTARDKGLQIRDGMSGNYFYFISRRPTFPGAFTAKSFARELSHTTWYWNNQVGMDDFENPPSKDYVLPEHMCPKEPE